MGNSASVALALHIGVPLGLGQLVGLLCAQDVLKWYPGLRKPRWTIPTWLFGPAWSVLYSCMGWAAYRVQQRGAGPLPMALYGGQLLLNLAWQPLFFRAKSFKWAETDIVALLGVLGATVWEFGKVDRTAAQLLLPYLAFSCYATALTFSISGKNPEAGRGSAAAGKPKAG